MIQVIPIPVRLTSRPFALAVVLSAVAIAACQPTGANPPASSPSEASAEPAEQASAPPRVDRPAPDFTGVDSNGNSHALDDYRGQVVVLEWTSHECPFTRKHYVSGNMQSLQADATEAGAVWLSVVSSAPDQQGYVEGPEANQIARDREAKPTAILLDPDGDIGRRYSARTTPHMFVIDEAGILRYMGGIDNVPSANPADILGATNFVRAALDNISNDQPVDTPFSPPYGCSVKYSL